MRLSYRHNFQKFSRFFFAFAKSHNWKNYCKFFGECFDCQRQKRQVRLKICSGPFRAQSTCQQHIPTFYCSTISWNGRWQEEILDVELWWNLIPRLKWHAFSWSNYSTPPTRHASKCWHISSLYIPMSSAIDIYIIKSAMLSNVKFCLNQMKYMRVQLQNRYSNQMFHLSWTIETALLGLRTDSLAQTINFKMQWLIKILVPADQRSRRLQLDKIKRSWNPVQSLTPCLFVSRKSTEPNANAHLMCCCLPIYHATLCVRTKLGLKPIFVWDINKPT